jgi:hypothetical protein
MEITVDLVEFVLAAADNWGGADGSYRDRCRKGIFRSGTTPVLPADRYSHFPRDRDPWAADVLK